MSVPQLCLAQLTKKKEIKKRKKRADTLEKFPPSEISYNLIAVHLVADIFFQREESPRLKALQ